MPLSDATAILPGSILVDGKVVISRSVPEAIVIVMSGGAMALLFAVFMNAIVNALAVQEITGRPVWLLVSETVLCLHMLRQFTIFAMC